jgi:uncharacterized protein (TIGR03083 family)
MTDAPTAREVAALEADRAELLRICAGLDEAEWRSESGCPGWSVKDLVTHMGVLFWAVVDPSVLPDTAGVPTEQAQEVYVQSRRSLRAAEVLADYSAVSEKAIAALEGFADVDAEVPLGDLGTYPARLLPAAFCFDHYTHIRADLFAPRGPLPGPLPPSDELRLTPTLDWIEAALPQQNPSAVDSLTGAVEIEITGLAGRTFRIGPADGPVSARVRSGADACVRWITQRASWESVGARGEGDRDLLGEIRRLKVF